MDFIESVARDIASRHALTEWHKITFVFQNNRQSVIFEDSLKQILRENKKAGKPYVVFGYNATTLGDLLAKGSKLTEVDQVTARCELYHAYLKTLNEGEEGMSFEKFYTWSSAIATDFEDIDKSMAGAHAVYSNVSEWQALTDDLSYITDEQRKAIEGFWNVTFDERNNAISGETESFLPSKSFVENYRRMKDLYDIYRQTLREKGLAYPGMLYREAAEGSIETEWDRDRERSYIFIGFSNLSRAEEKIMRKLSKAQRAEFYWDYSPEMLEEENKRVRGGAQNVIGKWVKEFPAPYGYEPPIGVAPSEQEIEIIRVPYSQTETAILSKKLQEEQSDSRRWAIVLSNEDMLMPVLSAIPNNVSRFNVTMGYKLGYAPIYGFVQILAEIQTPLWYRNLGSGIVYSNKVVSKLLQHPCVVSVEGLEATRKALKKMVDENLSLVSSADMSELPFVSGLLRVVEPQEVVDYMSEAVETIMASYEHRETEEEETETKAVEGEGTEITNNEELEGADNLETQEVEEVGEAYDTNPFNRETAYAALTVCRQAKRIMSLLSDDDTKSYTIVHIIAGMIEQQRISFRGIPYSGLQILGVLETRALDFDRVIVLDMTEGNWPQHKSGNTLIPMTIRRGHGLPTNEEMSGLYAYYFYRLKYRAKRMTIFQPNKAGRDNSEPSRYTQQMLMLPSKGSEEQNIRVLSPQYDISPVRLFKLSIDKHQIANRLDALRRISPTAITAYQNCGVKFFLERVMNLSEDDEIEEDIDDRQLGNIYHKVMEDLYKEHKGPKGTLLSESLLKGLLDDKDVINKKIVEGIAHELKLQNHIKTEGDLRGRNILTYNILKDYVMTTLRWETPNTVIVDTEQKVSTAVTLESGKILELCGTVDRQHLSADGRFYVADYKTGQVKKRYISSIEDMFGPQHGEVKAVMQTLVYCFMLRRQDANVHSRRAVLKDPLHIMIIRPLELNDSSKVQEGQIKGAKKGDPSTPLVYAGEFEQQFEERLLALLNEIFDLEKPFEQTNNLNTCKKCAYKNFCKR